MPGNRKAADPVGPVFDHREAAAELKVSIVTVRRMRRDGELRTVRVRGAVRIPQSDVFAYKAAHVSDGLA